jgi:magnesium transporter
MASKRMLWPTRRPLIRRRTLPGAAPGTVVIDPQAPAPVISVTAYGPDELIEEAIADPRAILSYLGKWPVTWINVDGLGDAETINALGEIFELHPLVLEDVVHTHQRPKFEEYDSHAFIITRMPQLEEAFRTEQVSIFLGADYVLTLQERPGDCFEPVRKRLRNQRGLVRRQGADYLAYALLDAVIDSYFPVLEVYGERLDDLETEISERPGPATVARIQQMKHDLQALRRTIWPQRDTLNVLIRDTGPFISDTTRVFLRDCYDHSIHIMELVETYHEVAAGLIEFYMSSVGHRMNEIMKVLTIMATIFIPLTFIAGIYGMNFNPSASPWNMPELNWYLGYPLALGLMVVVVLGMLFYFRRKRWIG